MRAYYPHALAVLLLCIAGWLWLKNWAEESAANHAGQTTAATPAKEVRAVPKTTVRPKGGVQVYRSGAALKDGLMLPQEAVADPVVEVVASSKIDGRDDHPRTITTTLNTESGETETYVRTDPLPWFAMSSKGSLGAYAGLKNGEPAIRLQAQQEVFRVKALSVGGVASVDQPMNGSESPDWFVGAGAELHW